MAKLPRSEHAVTLYSVNSVTDKLNTVRKSLIFKQILDHGIPKLDSFFSIDVAEKGDQI